MRLTLTLLGLTGLLMTTSCKKGLNDKESIVDVPKEFTIEMWDKLGENGDNLQLNISTIQNQDCEGVGIDAYAHEPITNRLVVLVKNLEIPQNCSGVKAPAHDTVVLPTSTKKGRYEFQFNLKDAVINKGFLTVEDNKFTIQMEQENGISFPTKEILRVPQNTVWGFIGFENGQENKANTMMDSLRTVATELNYANGTYGYFSVNNGTISLHNSLKTTKQNMRPFLMRLNSKEGLYDLAAFYKANSPLDFKILTADGKIFSK